MFPVIPDSSEITMVLTEAEIARRQEQSKRMEHREETVAQSVKLSVLPTSDGDDLSPAEPQPIPPMVFHNPAVPQLEGPVAAAPEPMQCQVNLYPYPRLCAGCHRLNLDKRAERAHMGGMVALVTGARVKIGFETGLKLLRCGCRLVAVTRFPRDCARRYAAEADYDQWKERLQIYGVDLRHMPSVMAFIAHLLQTLPRLDVLINNAAIVCGTTAHVCSGVGRGCDVTVRRPLRYYREVVEQEVAPAAASGPGADVLRHVAGAFFLTCPGPAPPLALGTATGAPPSALPPSVWTGARTLPIPGHAHGAPPPSAERVPGSGRMPLHQGGVAAVDDADMALHNATAASQAVGAEPETSPAPLAGRQQVPLFYADVLSGKPDQVSQFITQQQQALSAARPAPRLEASPRDGLGPAKTAESAALLPSSAPHGPDGRGDELALLPDDDPRYFPRGLTDEDGQQLDLRPKTSWNTHLAEVSPVEVLETQVVNSVVPFVLVSQLRPLLLEAVAQQRAANRAAYAVACPEADHGQHGHGQGPASGGPCTAGAERAGARQQGPSPTRAAQRGDRHRRRVVGNDEDDLCGDQEPNGNDEGEDEDEGEGEGEDGDEPPTSTSEEDQPSGAGHAEARTKGTGSWKRGHGQVGPQQRDDGVPECPVTDQLRKSGAVRPALAYVVNVSSPEGQFYTAHRKTGSHPHTNCAKASLNMLTRSSSQEMAEQSIMMTAVDTGWVSLMNPVNRVVRAPPLEVVDGAARVLDPVIAALRTGTAQYGYFFQNFAIAPW
ncbi:putative short-chain dehydrogenase [Paratrimastix pyriformis]|uniref:Short-chain dehydrogenase n=1 Tax=Paratrimastix pyriformis TaxID=342808 RepID=A0ABQ8UTU4_9EUKA|nr:putative short-chain dehydrogenase [Paratrimastix pyriformis]